MKKSLALLSLFIFSLSFFFFNFFSVTFHKSKKKSAPMLNPFKLVVDQHRAYAGSIREMKIFLVSWYFCQTCAGFALNGSQHTQRILSVKIFVGNLLNDYLLSSLFKRNSSIWQSKWSELCSHGDCIDRQQPL